MIDRSRIAFLGAGYDRLRAAVVTVVGAGGGGSHILQQLAHLAVGTLVSVDPDDLENSNVNRVVCTNYADIGMSKATLLVRNLSRLGGRMVALKRRAETPIARAWIERSDLVFGAVDGARARNNIEQICRAALVPYIDIGLTILTSTDGAVTAIGGQIVTSLPNGPCLQCADVVTDDSLAEDREEYADSDIEQQVISMNGLLASQAVTGGVALLANYAPKFPPPAVVRYDGLLHEMRSDDWLNEACPHFPLTDAGWTVVLPPRKHAA
jgi:molybdopterin/thiamine biosynthesis adenylyltransferase